MLDDAIEGSISGELADDVRRPILCASCRATLTYAGLGRDVEGAHEHTFFNPAGVVYAIRCFDDAPGAAIAGSPTDAFSWFAGWAWRIAHCAACRAHVGWRWERAGSFFFGLVTTALFEARDG